jgi:hypothetical protein
MSCPKFKGGERKDKRKKKHGIHQNSDDNTFIIIGKSFMRRIYKH